MFAASVPFTICPFVPNKTWIITCALFYTSMVVNKIEYSGHLRTSIEFHKMAVSFGQAIGMGQTSL